MLELSLSLLLPRIPPGLLVLPPNYLLDLSNRMQGGNHRSSPGPLSLVLHTKASEIFPKNRSLPDTSLLRTSNVCIILRHEQKPLTWPWTPQVQPSSPHLTSPRVLPCPSASAMPSLGADQGCHNQMLQARRLMQSYCSLFWRLEVPGERKRCLERALDSLKRSKELVKTRTLCLVIMKMALELPLNH